MQRHEFCQGAHAFFLRQIRIILRFLHQSVIGFVRSVILEHVENEAFLDRLPHAVEMKRFRFTRRASPTEKFQCLSLRRRGEGEETKVWLSAARLHDLIENVFPIRFIFSVGCLNLRAQN